VGRFRSRPSCVSSCNRKYRYLEYLASEHLHHQQPSRFLSVHSHNTSNTESASMRHCGPFALLVTTAAFISGQHPSSKQFCDADGLRLFSSAADATTQTTPVAETEEGENSSGCGIDYGVRLLPLDVYYNTDDTRNALQSMRLSKRTIVKDSAAAQILQSSSTEEHVTLTLIGFKGGTMQSQVNQDRAFIIPAYSIVGSKHCDEDEEKENTSPMLQDFFSQPRTLLGVFDGHAPRGELVAEYSMRTLPRLLADRIKSKSQALKSIMTTKDQINITKESLSEVFIELDKTAPADPSGGCTASIIFQQGRYIYVANAGDSRSFIVAYRPSTKTAIIFYISREDKPNLPEERARVQAAGGQVYIPPRGTSRVVFHNPSTGSPTGLAMSRSIGDWAAGQMGVIPDPIIQVLNIDEIVETVLSRKLERPKTPAQSYIVDLLGSVLNMVQNSKPSNFDDVYLLGVSATDGMMDYMQPDVIGQAMAMALFEDAGAHPITVAEHLIFEAAERWQRSKMGRYRDDIAISVSALRRPPH
jgi:serine/threonine protein phosphatase PrpC